MTINFLIVTKILGGTMPRAWNVGEKELVKKSLQTEGKKLFERHGLQKVTVEEIVRAARISKGAFYLFYPSKEMLYSDIVDAVQRENREKIYAGVSGPGVSHREIFKRGLKTAFDLLTSTPILQRHLNPSEYEYLKRKLPDETRKAGMASYMEEFVGFFSSWVERGWMRKIDPLGLNGLFLSLFYLIIHREDFDAAGFDAARRLWIDMISEYLVADEKQGDAKKGDAIEN
jgi:AcrR family transcriptional regulator